MAPLDDSIGNRAPKSAQDELLEIRDRLGRPPGDPSGDAVWASKASAEFAWFAMGHKIDDELAAQMKEIRDWIDRIAKTQTKATRAHEINQLKRKAGIGTKQTNDAVRVVSERRGGTRAASRGV